MKRIKFRIPCTTPTRRWWQVHQGRRDECNEAEKPAAPITWDGSDEALEVIRAALGDHCHVAAVGIANDLWILDGRDPHFEVRASFGARIRREGDSFVILPPEVK